MSLLRLASAAALSLALAACGAAAPESDEAFGRKVRAYLMEHPEVLEEAVTVLQQRRQLAANQQISEAVREHRQALERDPRDFVAGNPAGTITVTEFFDYRCGFCKQATPQLIELLRQNPDVRLVFKEYPILPDPGGQLGVSERAARLALAAKAQGRYLPVHVAMMRERALDDAAIERIARANGVDLSQAAQRARSPEVTDHLTDTRELATTLGVEGTPAFFVGDVMVPGADMEALRAAIARAREARRT